MCLTPTSSGAPEMFSKESICHAAGSHITHGVRQLLPKGLWFLDQETPVMLVMQWRKHGAETAEF